MTPEGASVLERRKAEHFDLALGEGAESRAGAGWQEVHLVHRAAPEVDFCEVDLSAYLLGRRFGAPLLVSGMTGGHRRAAGANAALAALAARFDLPMGVGSQRAALANPDLAPTYRAAREAAPDAFLIANLGAAQLVEQDGAPAADVGVARAAIEMIDADALAVHFNYTEEVVQPEGDRRARGVLHALARLAEALPVPVLAKETGAGISLEMALALADAGVAALDVGGAGGTSFATVEARRAATRGDSGRERLGQLLGGWGIPTPASIVAAGRSELPVVGSGGIRSGIDAAKALALGADMVGVARPLLRAALEERDGGARWVEEFLEQLRAAMFLTGSARIADLRRVRIVVTGGTREWIEQLAGSRIEGSRDRRVSESHGREP